MLSVQPLQPPLANSLLPANHEQSAMARRESDCLAGRGEKREQSGSAQAAAVRSFEDDLRTPLGRPIRMGASPAQAPDMRG